MTSKMDIDRPLDEIIATKAKPRRPRQGGAGARRGGTASGATSATGARARYATTVPKTVAAPQPFSAEVFKIIISNLPSDVTDAAVRDLMQSTVGPVKSVQMSYTATGKSTGTATVVFRNKGDARKAHASYHNRMIDNQRPMKVELAIDPNQARSSLVSRVAPAPAQPQKKRAPASKPRNPRPAKKTAEQLDAEMAEYKQSSTA
ncbi:THO complex subunit 4 [Cryptococcus deuterogattii R265]|uniref:THO complex subunit 4 n=1 Tax=Cryptococcus deuterogattii (strain R265) TaxID=294750 RepID=A0A095CA39_CRYD2|nr:THO complex subunit 4 [Cryptococcus deuterogattii R265]KIR27663.1 THO complex subunit 4 [Cryptococcus deuterogattii LA55]KIR73170.1 THO complex subunit 4 [Cryptococcus deuterogattii CA1014]KIR90053.1 THO complex subunit 4 [Cryptococcus deuterogattii CBS 10090]